MEKTMKVTGMKCGGCSGRAQRALEALPEVEKAVASHETGTVVVTLKSDVANEVLKKTLEDVNFQVTDIQ